MATKVVRGWLGASTSEESEATDGAGGSGAGPPGLDLRGEGYRRRPLSVGEQNALNAKLTLMTTGDPDQPSLYEHVSELLREVLETREADAVDVLERLSGRRKLQRMPSNLALRPAPDQGRNPGLFHDEWSLFKTVSRSAPNAAPEVRTQANTDSDDALVCLPDLMRQAHLFSLAGLGLPQTHYVRITLALRDLAHQWPFVSLRLWGVVHGLHNDYTVAEGEFREGDYETDMSDDEDDDDDEQVNESFDDAGSEAKPDYKPPRKVPSEPPGVGLNRKVYFVCTQPGAPWQRLPHVTPAQIQASRQIRKFFTGDLHHAMVTNPPFPGSEMNYLRAQIARISAATHVSPIGVFKFDEEEEEEAEGGRDTCVVDLDFEGVAMKELSDPGLMSWVHHAPYILPQGRTTWHNPVSPRDAEEGEDEEGEEPEERMEPDEPEPEVGPPLLSTLAEDAEDTGGQPAWVGRASTKLVPEYALATVHSVIWPGAVALATDNGRFFENLYVGWGHKSCVDNFEPAVPEAPKDEFPTGPEVAEVEDPSPATEAAFKAALREQELALVGGEEEEDEEAEDGIIEDDDDGPDLSD